MRWLIVVVVASGCAAPKPCEDQNTGFVGEKATGGVCINVTMNGVNEGKACPDKGVGVAEPAGQVIVTTTFEDGTPACDPITVNVSACQDQFFECPATP